MAFSAALHEFRLGALALNSLLHEELGAAPLSAAENALPHFAPKAKQVIFLFMSGGPSHLDMFDPKPELNKLDGKDFPGDVKYDDAAGATSGIGQHSR